MSQTQTQRKKVGISMDAPRYSVKEVIDLRFSNTTMPDRIYVQMVYMKDNSTEWMYQVFSEKSNGIVYMSESQIGKLESKRDSGCYNNAVVSELYKNGFRFCGNNKRDTAFNRANGMVSAKYIKHIILADAVNKDGQPMPDHLGLWVQYNATIERDSAPNSSGHYIIK